MNNTNNALETLVQRDKQIKKANDKLKTSINELEAELETTTNALSNHASNTEIHTSKEELIQLIVDHLESLDLGITKEVVSVLPTENISDNTLYFVPNEKGFHNEYLYINDKWELVGGTETNFTDYYTKLETNTLLEGKANSVHSHVVSDITDFPPIPTKLSQLENDMGFGSGSGGVITSISWTNITDKPNFSTVATSGSYNDLSDKPTIPKVHNKTLTIQKNGTNVATFTSNSNTDVTADITVPTKVSELSNDSGFITGISWDKVTNKPTLATVATSGSYTDLSNTPTIPTKVSQLENDTGFINALTDVVDTKSNQTINGTKTFTAGPVASNSATTNGYSIKLNAVARNEVPSQLYHATFRALDKNSKILGEYCIEKSNSGSTLAHINVRSEDSNGKQLSESLYLNMSNDGSTVRFYPSSDNKMDLGTANNKWAKIYSNDVVHTSGDEYIHGTKMFSGAIHRYADLTTSVGEQVYRFVDSNANGCGHIYNNVYWYDAGIHNRPGAYNAKSGKTMELEIVSYDSGVGMLYIEGTATKGNVEFATSATEFVGIATMGWVNNPATSTNVVHRSGDENINGTKKFSNIIHRYADLTTSTAEQVYRFDDSNANGCGHIYNNVHWHDSGIYNRHGAYNAKSGKSTEIDIISYDSGVGMAYVAGTTTKGNLVTATSDTGYTAIATMGWVNNPATSTNVVHRSGNETISGDKLFGDKIICTRFTHYINNSHIYLAGGSEWDKGATLVLHGEESSDAGTFIIHARDKTRTLYLVGRPDGTLTWGGKSLAIDENLVHTSGNETIAGTKTFSGTTISNKQLQYKDTVYDWSDTALNTWCDAGHVVWFDKTGTRRMHELVGANGGVWRKVCYIKESQYFSVDSNRNISFSGTTTFNGNLTASKFIGNLQGNADSSTKASCLDNYSLAGGNKIYLDWDKQVTGYVGLKVDKTTMGGLITTKNIGSQAVNSATYSTTPATTDNSTRIATTAWVRTYVNSVAGSGGNTLGSSISAYWSNMSYVTATRTLSSTSSAGYYPACYTDYINLTPVVGTIYSGAQLYTVLNASASARGEKKPQGQYIECTTTVIAEASFSNPINSAGKYLCTTANTVRFTAYGKGSDSGGSASVEDNTSTKSIFIRVE